jgi:hypothetical protein
MTERVQDFSKDHSPTINMKLSQIDLRGVYKSKISSEFQKESWSVSEFYWSLLKGYNTYKVQKINIIAVDVSESQSLNTMDVQNFKEASIVVDFQSYSQSDNFNKKKIQLEAVHKGMMQIAEKEGWETDPLLDAYNKCLEKNLAYQFEVGKSKASPDKKHKIGFWCNWDIDIFEVYWILYDKSGNELKREKFIEKKAFDGEFIYYSKFNWKDSNTVIFEDKYKYGTNEVWEFNPFK